MCEGTVVGCVVLADRCQCFHCILEFVIICLSGGTSQHRCMGRVVNLQVVVIWLSVSAQEA